VLNLFHEAGVVHADLKPDNILIDFDEQRQEIRSMKIIDLGSSFLLNVDETKLKDQIEFGQSTPEYLPPEIQLYLTRKFTQQNNYQISDFSEIAFVFDVWSLGSILLEIISGFPLWLSLKARVKSLDNRSIINYGIFGVSGRDNGKIL
jgi:dual specificity protein kinase YAK1